MVVASPATAASTPSTVSAVAAATAAKAAAAVATSSVGPGLLSTEADTPQPSGTAGSSSPREGLSGEAVGSGRRGIGAMDMDSSYRAHKGRLEATFPSTRAAGTAGEEGPAGEGHLPGLRELELREKAVSAAAAAVLSAILVNPLDVAKTRLQAQAAGVPYVTPSWDHVSPRYATAGKQAHAALEYTGTWDVMYKVARQEGVVRLWRGTSAGLILAVPTVGIYLPVYDILREWLERGPEGTPTAAAPYAPLLAGAISRSLAVVCCSPLELARTRIQAHKGVRGGAEPPGIRSILRDVLSHAREGPGAAHWRRVGLLWTGVGAQLARDVPFSAICWASLEPTRKKLLQLAGPDPSLGQILGANFGAGLLAGTLAASVTTPLDVAKTRRQIETDPVKGRQMSTFRTLSQVYREHGSRGLFTGIVPRIGRAAPSVGMVVAFYEIVKHVIRTQS